MFRDDAAKYLTAIRQALQENDATALQRSAHALKGASMNTGALALGALGARLESAAEGGDLGGAAPVVTELEAEIQRVNADIALELSASA